MMVAQDNRLDIVLAVPFQPLTAYAVDPMYRSTLGAHMGIRIGQATAEFEQFLGRPLTLQHWRDNALVQEGIPQILSSAHRSLTAVSLATCLDRAGLNWSIIDPGVKELGYYRKCFEKLRAQRPRIVGISTTFAMSGPWLQAFCALVRRILPESTLIVGGSYYITSTHEFLSLDADIFFIGEGEERLPDVVRAVREGRSLDHIPGLYLRDEAGKLRTTGRAKALDLNAVEPVNWKLAERVEPFVDLENEPTYYYIETQRGCKFRCTFCTYHTMSAHEEMSVKTAVDAILRPSMFKRGYTFLVDATATFPRERWMDIMRELAARGGSPHPMMAFARVTDINEEVAELMSKAGVHEVFVGQESGDQRMLNHMKKGTKVEHVAPAVRALGKYGIGAQFCFIHGFPGENLESLRNTRQMLATMNADRPDKPVVYTYILSPFHSFDFAPVAQKLVQLQGVQHPVGYDSGDLTPKRASEEVLNTVIQMSRIPHAPTCSFLFDGQAHFLFTVCNGPRRYDVFRWLKALERGVAIFLEKQLEGTAPDMTELRKVRDTVLKDSKGRSAIGTAMFRFAAGIRAQQAGRLRKAWAAETPDRPHSMTRAFMGITSYSDFGRVSDAIRGYRTARYPTHDLKYQKPDDNVQALSNQMIEAHMHAKPAPALVQLQPNSAAHGAHAGHRPHQPHEPQTVAEADTSTPAHA